MPTATEMEACASADQIRLKILRCLSATALYSTRMNACDSRATGSSGIGTRFLFRTRSSARRFHSLQTFLQVRGASARIDTVDRNSITQLRSHCDSVYRTRRNLLPVPVTRAFDVGIDVEFARDSTDVLALAERFFAPREVSTLRALPTDRQIDQFISTWTLKEAYAKARGLGLSLPLHDAAFQVEGGLIDANFESETADQQNDWAFCLMGPTAKHWLAVAARVGGAALPGIDPQWLVPLTSPSHANSCPIVAATRSF